MCGYNKESIAETFGGSNQDQSGFRTVGTPGPITVRRRRPESGESGWAVFAMFLGMIATAIIKVIIVAIIAVVVTVAITDFREHHELRPFSVAWEEFNAQIDETIATMVREHPEAENLIMVKVQRWVRDTFAIKAKPAEGAQLYPSPVVGEPLPEAEKPEDEGPVVVDFLEAGNHDEYDMLPLRNSRYFRLDVKKELVVPGSEWIIVTVNSVNDWGVMSQGAELSRGCQTFAITTADVQNEERDNLGLSELLALHMYGREGADAKACGDGTARVRLYLAGSVFHLPERVMDVLEYGDDVVWFGDELVSLPGRCIGWVTLVIAPMEDQGNG